MKTNIILAELTRIIDEPEIEKQALKMKVVKKARKIKIIQFIWALVFSSLGQEKRSISVTVRPPKTKSQQTSTYQKTGSLKTTRPN